MSSHASATAPRAPEIPSLPEPRLRHCWNRTPFVVLQCQKMAPGRRYFDTVVLKGTFDLVPGVIGVAASQAPVALVDEHWDPAVPQRSSVKQAGEALLGKPGTDVMVTGTVRCPEGRPLAAWDVAVVVKDPRRTVLEHTAQVTGPRAWRHRRGRGWVLGDPEPTVDVPIRYELAYGGAYLVRPSGVAVEEPRWVVHPSNPSGTGFCDESALDEDAAYPAPRWQHPLHPVTALNEEVPVAGLGPIARPWSARLQYAGTYDDAWRSATRADVERGLPADYAADFDARFFHSAHPALIAGEHLRGDEHLGLGGMIPGQPQFVTRLPGLSARARILPRGGVVEEARMPLDTVHVDLDARAVHLCWRLSLDHARDIEAAEIHTTEDP